jgi:hypothetical protein
MIENKKCIVGLKKDGGYIIPHEADVTHSVQCDQPVVAMEKYADFDNTVLPVCEKHRHLIQMLYEDFKAWEAAGKPI